tara:strand:- start:1750 stop:2418 length:669 start_codon:yes stop_codon:yes gene_type:complete
MSLNSFASINHDDPETSEIFEYREKNMCNSFNMAEKNLPLCDVKIINNEDSYIVNGKLKGGVLNLSNQTNLYVKYWAANPPTFSSNFSGSGLPYPNEDIAFEKSDNLGMVQVAGGNFSFSLKHPNSYYKNMGATYIHPEVQLQLFDNNTNKSVSEIQHVNLGEGIPYRTLTYPYQRNWNNGPMFYKKDTMPSIRSQEQILLDSAYPDNNKMPKNFWGKKPPC